MDAVRRCAVILIGVLATTGPSVAQAPRDRPFEAPPPVEQSIGRIPARPPGSQLPLERLVPYSPQVNARMPCRPSSISACDDRLGFVGMEIWRILRRCWQPPVRVANQTMTSTEVRFGEDGKSAQPPNPAKSVVSVTFRLQPNGRLIARPRANGAEPSSAPPDLIDKTIAAIEQCQPYEVTAFGAKYEDWRDVFLRIGIEYLPAGAR